MTEDLAREIDGSIQGLKDVMMAILLLPEVKTLGGGVHKTKGITFVAHSKRDYDVIHSRIMDDEINYSDTYTLAVRRGEERASIVLFGLQFHVEVNRRQIFSSEINNQVAREIKMLIDAVSNDLTLWHADRDPGHTVMSTLDFEPATPEDLLLLRNLSKP